MFELNVHAKFENYIRSNDRVIQTSYFTASRNCALLDNQIFTLIKK